LTWGEKLSGFIERRLGAVSFSALAITALLCVPAGADPGPSAGDIARSRAQVRERADRVGRIDAELAQASGRLDDLSDQAELAVERYNGERVRLERAGQAYRDAVDRAARARERASQTRADLAVFAANAYRTDDSIPSGAAVVGGRGGPEGFMDRAVMMQVLAARRQAFLDRQRAAESLAGMFGQQARQALAAQQGAARGAATALRAANDAVARQRAAMKQIQQRKTRLVAALGAARARAASLEQQQGTGEGRSIARRLSRGSGLGSVAATAALKWLGTPYSWGGGDASGPTQGIQQGSNTVGFDCSGLVTYAWARAGVRLAHYATSQWASGPHPSRSELRPGDLVFYAHDPSNPSTIHHVGIYIGDGRMVEAPFTGARVRISNAFRPDYAGATRPSG
jgi:cell wall-associated NlpC family hydrolase